MVIGFDDVTMLSGPWNVNPMTGAFIAVVEDVFAFVARLEVDVMFRKIVAKNLPSLFSV